MIRWLGVDVGWVFPAADSDGNVYRWTSHRRPREWVAVAGPVTVHRADGTTSTLPPYSLEQAAQVMARSGRDEGALWVLSARIVNHALKTGQGIALEDWLHFERRKAAWVDVWRFLAAHAVGRGVPVIQVDRAYTSITCPSCHRKARANRETRDRFRCIACGFSGHADVIAAMNIAAKAAGRFEIDPEECSNPACAEGLVWSAGLCLFCYRFRHRHGRLPAVRDFAERARSKDGRKYRTAMRRRALQEAERRRDAATTDRLAESYRTHDAWGNPLAQDA